MQIKPYKNKIQIKIQEPKVGNLDLSSKKTATEVGEVIAIGENVKDIKVGDIVMFKSWGVDIITYQDEQYYFISCDAECICAII